MTYVEQDEVNELTFRVEVPIDEDIFQSLDLLALDVMRLPRSTQWQSLKAHQRTQYRKILDGVQSGHLLNAMWDVDAINWCQRNVKDRWDFNVSGWLQLADESITITFRDREAAMLFKLTWVGSQ